MWSRLQHVSVMKCEADGECKVFNQSWSFKYFFAEVLMVKLPVCNER